MKNFFRGQKYAYIYCLNTKIRLTMLCLSGFELYSRWVPLFFLSPSSKTRESLQPWKPLQKSLLQPKISDIYTYYCSKVQFSAFFEYPEQHLLFFPVYHFKFFNVRIYT